MTTIKYRLHETLGLTLALSLTFAVLQPANVRGGVQPAPAQTDLSPYMNSVPPSEGFFCVGTGPTNQALHPDRSPHTQLAQQNGVLLFSGTAPQQGLNFQLSAGALVYRNQMSTLGSSEPSPQVGTAGLLQQKPWEKLQPWSEARWHPGEDISWQGYRHGPRWLAGIQYYKWLENSTTTGQFEPDSNSAFGPFICQDSFTGDDTQIDIYTPKLLFLQAEVHQGIAPGLPASVNLQLSRGVHQLSRPKRSLLVEDDGSGIIDTECGYVFREPWFQGRGRDPVFNVSVDAPDGTSIRLAQDYYPNFLNIYPYEKLEMRGGRLVVDFERSATWPREPAMVDVPDISGIGTPSGGGLAGTSLARGVNDEYGNRVHFDRVPKYNWETDYKAPQKGMYFAPAFPPFVGVDQGYNPTPQAWRLPHKRLRTVQLFEKDDTSGTPSWTIAYVFEHPESDRISDDDTPDTWNGGTTAWGKAWEEWKSIYSHLPQADWAEGRLPELNDETTLLTVQAYKRDPNITVQINGAKFQDDYSVWQGTIGTETAATKNRANTLENTVVAATDWRNDSTDPPGETVPATADDFPGVEGVDDDGDGLIDEDSNGYEPYLTPADPGMCQTCQNKVFAGIIDETYCHEGASNNYWPRQDGTKPPPNTTGCYNPLYWKGGLVGGNWQISAAQNTSAARLDPFSAFDDDEDGIVDEDGPDDPLLVHLRGMQDDVCAAGVYPFVPNGGHLPSIGTGGTSVDEDCRDPLSATDDPWTYQVQYVYARSNPFWLLTGPAARGQTPHPVPPRYKYYPPFGEPFTDNDKNGIYDSGEPFIDINGSGSRDEFKMSGSDPATVHPDCLPHPEFRGPQGKNGAGTVVPPNKPSDIHLIKRIVRMRDDVINAPQNFTEQIWLYRYNDIGFLKAVFEPADVLAIIDADPSDSINEPDDILRLADSHELAGLPLIMYASQWYTYYNPYVDPVYQNVPLPGDSGNKELVGLPQCYEETLVPGICATFDNSVADDNNPNIRLPVNGCDGEQLWVDEYSPEVHVDRDCSDFMRQDCGWCYARTACSDECTGQERPAFCDCANGSAVSDNALRQMGIPDAQPRFRKYMIKTARVRGGDREMHSYRFDYLGAPSGAYTSGINSYADPHNITIVDELVEQDAEEFDDTDPIRNEFYIYEDDFRFDLDSGPPSERGVSYTGGRFLYSSSHYLSQPVKVKTRRVVVMNYYGIATSDRLILTPGFEGDQTSLVDNQQYELLNTRGQAKHIFDPSWVAGLREKGINYIKDEGRVLTELFGGADGWYSVLKGIARGSGGGNLYEQQCATPQVLNDVPVQRVKPDQLTVVTATKLFDRDATDGVPDPVDLPETEGVYYKALPSTAFSFNNNTPANGVFDPAGTVGEKDCPVTEPSPDSIDLHKQEPVVVNNIPDSGSGNSYDDGVSQTNYDYEFWAGDAVKWKRRWQESVPLLAGGTGKVALEVWFFDQNGRLRLHGQGSGDSTATPPIPVDLFHYTYFGYDDIGRLAFQVGDVGITWLTDNKGELFAADAFDDLTNGFNRQDPNAPAANLTTQYKFNDMGMLTSRCVGYPIDPIADPITWNELIRTDYKLLANRTISHKTTGGSKSLLEWQDPHMYQLEYQHVEDDGLTVNGTTAVTVMDKAGGFLEQRVIGWNDARPSNNSNDKIDDFGWGVALSDYSYDGAIDTWDANTQIDSPYWSGCSDGQSCANHINDLNGTGSYTPAHPSQETPPVVWPPQPSDQIVTLARSFKQYNQASTLKPTDDIVFNDFTAQPPGSPSTPDRRAVVRNYVYDLEDRIARQRDPDGTITRLLFDSKRRATKIFKGSNDTCSDWFPPVNGTGTDNMVLMEHRLYNDGTSACEHSPMAGGDDCTTTTGNEDFPYDANKLVRVRRFTDHAEACSTAYEENTHSRDTQISYDWRGRPIVERELSVGYDGGTAGNPQIINVTTAVFDNLNRPLLIATWDKTSEPSLDRVEAWQEMTPDAVINECLTRTVQGLPQTLSQTMYDERGRVYEQRTYNPVSFSSTPNGMPQYTYIKTFRDDLDRVIAEITPQGKTVSQYDSLGRVIETAHWSRDENDDPETHEGTELSCTQTEYNAFGNVLRQIHYDAKSSAVGTTGGAPAPIVPKFTRTPSGQLDDLSTPNLPAQNGNAIITYTYNWYDNAKRLIATANFGNASGSDNLFVNGNPPAYDKDTPPASSTAGYGTDAGALVTRFGYDAASRRIWTQDPKGIFTRTWHDLLGRTLLQAENWKDASAENLTPSHNGPIRYTAYHYTRAGLQDMIVAIVPDPAAQPFVMTPNDIVWDDGDSTTDFAAAGITSITGSPDYQATSFVYNATIVNESDQAAVSVGTNLIAEIRYPNSTTGEPDPADALKFKYTIGGHVAQRTDQRGVELNYEYGTCETCTPDSDWPGDMLSAVKVDYTNADTTVAQTTDRLAFEYNARGLISSAKAFPTPASTLPTSTIAYDYDSFSNLLSETLDPDPANSTTGGVARTTSYEWSWPSDDVNLLASMTYPTSGTKFDFTYASDIHRMTGIESGGSPFIAYDTTGTGRSVEKNWGVTIGPLANPTTMSPALDRFGRISQMQFTNEFVGTPQILADYEYGHDKTGNRTHAKVSQKNHTNDRSYLYQYDELNRLAVAERGVLGATNDFIASGGKGQAWRLDLLGNWTGEPSVGDGLIDYDTGDTVVGYDSTMDSLVRARRHDVDKSNRVTDFLDTYSGEPGNLLSVTHDAAGNLTDIGSRKYVYNAWNRLVEVLDNNVTVAKYDYDAIGRRIAKTAGNAAEPTEYFVYDGHRVIEHHIADANGDFGAPDEYLYGLDYIDELIWAKASGPTGGSYFVLQDAGYDVVGLVSQAAGSLIEQRQYKPYGDLSFLEDGAGGSIDMAVVGPQTIQGYKGMRHDFDTGLVSAINRDYDPITGRWLQADPNQTALLVQSAMLRNAQTASAFVGLPTGGQYTDGPNIYQFVGSNPVTGRDPKGLSFSAFLDAHQWFTERAAAKHAIYAAENTQNVLWNEDFGDDEYSDAIDELLVNRDHAISLLDNVYNKAVGGKSLAKGYAVASVDLLALWMTSLAPDVGVLGSAALGFGRFASRVAQSGIGSRYVAASTRLRGKGVRVLGSRRDVRQFKGRQGYRVFDEGIADPKRQWAANKRFLEEGLKNGEIFVQVTNEIAHTKIISGFGKQSYLIDEIHWLRDHGYTRVGSIWYPPASVRAVP